MTILITFIILLWIIPLTLMARIKWGTALRMLLGLVMSVVVVIGAVILNSWFELRWIPALGLDIVPFTILRSLAVGFVEEGLKLIAALLCTIKMKSQRKIDYILVFGSVGAGFEIIESIAAASDLITMALRVLLALHVVWLYYEGSKFFDFKNGRKMSLFAGYLTVLILHAVFDFGGLLMASENASDTLQAIGLIFIVVGVIINVIFIFKTMKKVIKETKC